MLEHGGDLLPQRGGVVEHGPGGAVVDRRTHVATLGIRLPLVVQRVRQPHAGRLGEIGLEHAVLGGAFGWHGRHPAVPGVAQDVSHALHQPRVEREHVPRHAASGMLATKECEGPIPGVIGRLHPVEGVDQGIAAGQRDGDEVGLHLHLARERALQELQSPEGGIDQGADRPHDQTEQPAHPRHAEVDTAQGVQHGVQLVAPSHQIRGELPRHVRPPQHRHGPLGEVSEFVCQHGPEFPKR